MGVCPRHILASQRACPRSPNQPPWPWTPRRRRSRRPAWPVIGFGAGELDFPTAGYIVEAAQRACAEPRFHKYTPAAGLPELRQAVADKTARDSGFRVTAGQVLITNGGKQAVFQTFAALLDPGDEVLVPVLYWTTYPEAIQLAGGVTIPVATDESTGYLASVADLEAARTERTKILLFVSPSNPTGAVYPPEQVAQIGRWAAANGLWVVTDEIYEHLVYGDAEFSSMPVVAPEVTEQCVVVNGVAKTTDAFRRGKNHSYDEWCATVVNFAGWMA